MHVGDDYLFWHWLMSEGQASGSRVDRRRDHVRAVPLGRADEVHMLPVGRIAWVATGREICGSYLEPTRLRRLVLGRDADTWPPEPDLPFRYEDILIRTRRELFRAE